MLGMAATGPLTIATVLAVGDEDLRAIMGSALKKFSPYTYYVLTMGALVASIAAVAMAVLGLYVHAGLYATLCFSSCFGAYFAPRRSMEDMLAELKSKVSAIKSNTQVVEQNRVALEKIEQGRQAENKEAAAEQQSLKEQLEAANRQSQQNLALLSVEKAERERISKLYNKVQAESQKAMDAMKLLIEADGKAEAQAATNADVVQHIDTEVSRSETLLTQVKATLDTKNAKIEDLNKKIASLSGQLTQLITLSQAENNELRQIAQSEAELKNQDASLISAVNKSGDGTKAMHAQTQQLALLNAKLTAFQQQLKTNQNGHS